MGRVELVESGGHGRRNRVVNGDDDHPEREGHKDGRGEELPDRDARGARNDEFVAATEAQKAGHGAEQHCEGHGRVADTWQVEERHTGQKGERDVVVLGAPAHQFHEIDHVNDDQEQPEGQERRGEKALAEI